MPGGSLFTAAGQTTGVYILESRKKNQLLIKDICMTGIMVAVIEVCKIALSFLPNTELTTFWLIMFTLFFGRRSAFAVPVFILLEGCVYGFGIWWVMYLYIWPLLVLFTWIFRRQESIWFWSTLSAVFGLLFGLFCAVPYIVTGCVGADIKAGLYTAFTWWVAGIPWDIMHGISNFILMLILYHPVRAVMQRIKKHSI